MRIVIALFSSLFFVSTAFAIPAITCHCFKDRSYDAARPGIVDPYLLATTQNSFMAAVFDIPKREVVQSKMSGASGDDLWVAYYAANKSGADTGKLMSDKKAAGSWKTLFERQGTERLKLGPAFNEALTSGAPEETLAAVIADQMLVTRLGAKPVELKKLRSKGASTKEVILSTVFSLRSGRKGSEFYNTVKSGSITWGEHLNSLGMLAKDMKLEVKKMVK